MTSGTATGRPDWATVPNAITLLRLVLIVPICVLLIRDAQPVLTAVLATVFALSDWVDGVIARRFGQTSRFGTRVDPIADRLGVAAVAVALIIGGHLPWWIGVLVAGTDCALAVVFLLRRGTVIPSVTRLGKVRTAILLTGLVMVTLGRIPELDAIALPGTVVAGVGAVLHALTGLSYGRTIIRSGRA